MLTLVHCCLARRQARKAGAEPPRAAGSDLIVALCKASQPAAALRVFEDMTAVESAWGQVTSNPKSKPAKGMPAAKAPPARVAAAAAPRVPAPVSAAPAAGSTITTGSADTPQAPVLDAAGTAVMAAAAAASRPGTGGNGAGSSAQAAALHLGKAASDPVVRPVLERPRAAGVRLDAEAAAAPVRAAQGDAAEQENMPSAEAQAVGTSAAAPSGAATMRAAEGGAAQGRGLRAVPLPAPKAPLVPGGAGGAAALQGGGSSGNPPLTLNLPDGAKRRPAQPRLPQRSLRAAAARHAVVPHLAAVGALVHGFACAGDLATAFRLYQQARPARCAPWGTGACGPAHSMPTSCWAGAAHLWCVRLRCTGTGLCFGGLQQGGQRTSFQRQMLCVVESA